MYQDQDQPSQDTHFLLLYFFLLLHSVSCVNFFRISFPASLPSYIVNLAAKAFAHPWPQANKLSSSKSYINTQPFRPLWLFNKGTSWWSLQEYLLQRHQKVYIFSLIFTESAPRPIQSESCDVRVSVRPSEIYFEASLWPTGHVTRSQASHWLKKKVLI